MNFRSEEQFINHGELITRNFQLLSNLTEKYWDMLMMNLGSLSWLNEQWENMFQNYLEQRKNTRQELTDVAEKMVNQFRKNSSQAEELLKQAWKTNADSISAPNIPGFASYMDLVKKVDELSKKAEEEKTNDK
jgi:hypothetical protein